MGISVNTQSTTMSRTGAPSAPESMYGRMAWASCISSIMDLPTQEPGYPSGRPTQFRPSLVTCNVTVMLMFHPSFSEDPGQVVLQPSENDRTCVRVNRYERTCHHTLIGAPYQEHPASLRRLRKVWTQVLQAAQLEDPVPDFP